MCCRKAKIQQYTVKYLQSNAISPVFLICDLDLLFLFQIFKVRETRSFSYVAKIMKKSAILRITFAIERLKSRFSPP